MTTMTLPAPTVKTTRKPASPCSCRLTLSIGDNDYRVRPIDAGFAGIKAYRLKKLDVDGVVYDVVQGVDELRCDCADYEFRHAGMGTLCKHLRAMVACGLLTAPEVEHGPKGGHETPTLEPAEGTQQVSTPEPASKVERVPPSQPDTVDALDWAHAICGKLWDVATPAQRDFAVGIMNNDSGLYFQRRITPGGPSLEELRARLAESGKASPDALPPVQVEQGSKASGDAFDRAPAKGVGSTDAIAKGVNSTDTPEDVRSTDTPASTLTSDEGQAPCCAAAESVPCKPCAADSWPFTPAIDSDTWGIAGGLTGDPEPASDEELEGFDPDNLTFREIPDVPPEHNGPDDDRPEDDSSAPRLSVAEWIRNEADRYEAIGTAAADLIAETLASLARGFDRVGASTVEQYKDRWAAIEAPGV